jgi:cell division protein FtsL
MSYGTQQLIFLIILLVVMAVVVIGTLVFTALVDRSLTNEGAQSQTRRDRQNDEQTSGESNADDEGGGRDKR